MAPILLVMLMCVADLAFAINARMKVRSAAQAGAQHAILRGYSADDIARVVTATTSLQGVSASPAPRQFCACASVSGLAEVSCGATCSTQKPAGTYVSVSATAVSRPVLDYPLLPEQFNFTEQATVRIR